jgi:hypothetical protein
MRDMNDPHHDSLVENGVEDPEFSAAGRAAARKPIPQVNSIG